ncbi:MAG: hypothetical protein CGU28_06170 [Candidatus Dactylopiibacterium carminicum]|uniref:Diguanylate cyclase n=1 Tax=Candidatus Dactylopiibacterium carminicum TaxID=857335 RepID=A0A272ET49_9RHOO|nr:diguanylate cyclase [Candidatus Dactylopiibacterium carminicum]KAF7599159.1 hypothetical protein BGI27_09250 [Candidatus Dactylopiibacterium carminicum]PAS93269.1 MAG: hypothetical protein CGU29_08505 [Candidatus Dactylopiibacterium carminicum]PAS97096.1 MAG: hypothetical protein CGU28_06170 [Candidatus Dactylopiibacterium carminicum]PAS99173.1 MAG: hypothetical protein BSR46_09260 [Candidatus Dactylopiibacterium carminicum]
MHTPRLGNVVRHIGSHLGFLVLATVFAASIAASTVFNLYRMYAEELEQQHDIAGLQARAVEDHLTQYLNLLSLSLINTAQPPTNRELVAMLRNAPALRSLSVVDKNGGIVASANPANLGRYVNLLDFLPPGTPDSDYVAIGRPWRGRDFSDGSPILPTQAGDGRQTGFLPMLRNVRLDDGRTVLLLVALNPDYFINHYSNRLALERGSVDVLRYDGIQLFSTDERFRPGALRADAIYLASINDVEAGTFEETLYGTQPSISAFRASRLFPVIVELHLEREYVLSRWTRESRRLLTLVLPALIGLMFLMSWLYLHLRRRETERSEAQQRDRERLAATVFTHSREGIIITDAKGHIVEVNEAFSRITGYAHDDVIGRTPRLLSSRKQPASFYTNMWRDLLRQGSWLGELWSRRRDGSQFAALLTISTVRDHAGQTRNYVALFSDITQMKEQQQHLEYIAHYDTLTRLPNRSLLQDRLTHAISQSLRRELCLALVYIDLDGFKQINDRFGHDSGDTLLVELAQRMRAALRDSDTLARVGGDEFVALLVDLRHPSDSEPVLQRLLTAAASPVADGCAVLEVSASLGVVFFPLDATEPECLLQLADRAMYQAKQAGKNTWRAHASHF